MNFNSDTKNKFLIIKVLFLDQLLNIAIPMFHLNLKNDIITKIKKIKKDVLEPEAYTWKKKNNIIIIKKRIIKKIKFLNRKRKTTELTKEEIINIINNEYELMNMKRKQREIAKQNENNKITNEKSLINNNNIFQQCKIKKNNELKNGVRILHWSNTSKIDFHNNNFINNKYDSWCILKNELPGRLDFYYNWLEPTEEQFKFLPADIAYHYLEAWFNDIKNNNNKNISNNEILQLYINYENDIHNNDLKNEEIEIINRYNNDLNDNIQFFNNNKFIKCFYRYSNHFIVNEIEDMEHPFTFPPLDLNAVIANINDDEDANEAIELAHQNHQMALFEAQLEHDQNQFLKLFKYYRFYWWCPYCWQCFNIQEKFKQKNILPAHYYECLLKKNKKLCCICTKEKKIICEWPRLPHICAKCTLNNFKIFNSIYYFNYNKIIQY